MKPSRGVQLTAPVVVGNVGESYKQSHSSSTVSSGDNERQPIFGVDLAMHTHQCMYD